MAFKDYFRNIPPVTLNLLVINLLVWVVLLVLSQTAPAAVYKFQNFAALHYFTSPQFNPAQLLTYMFVQQEFTHLFFNMFALFIFGSLIERVLGSKRYLFYYISCGLGAALIQEGVFALMINHYAAMLPDGVTVSEIVNADVPNGYMLNTGFKAIDQIWSLANTPMIGASGAVFGILLAIGMLFPRMPMYLFFIPVPIQARWIVIGYGVLELLLGIGNFSGDTIAHFAHLGGMLIGFAIIFYWKKRMSNGGGY